MSVSKLNFSGGFGDVIEEVLSPTEAMILSTYFDNKLRRGAEYFAEDPTLGFEIHQVPSDIYEKLPLWSAKYRDLEFCDLEIWRRRKGGDKTLIIIGVNGRGTPQVKITVLARFIVQPGDLERSRVVQHVTTLREMKEVLRKEAGTKPPALTLTGEWFNNFLWPLTIHFFFLTLTIMSQYLANGTLNRYLYDIIPVSLMVALPLFSLPIMMAFPNLALTKLPAFFGLRKIPKLWKENKAPHIRACDLHDAEFAEARAKWEGG